jgi:hypothetical protein
VKFITALGGFVGFAIGVGGGLIGGREGAYIFLQAGVATAVGAVSFQWLHRVLLRGVEDSIRTQREAKRKQSAADSAKNVLPAR